MKSKPKLKRKPKQIYRTVIKLKPNPHTSKHNQTNEPDIEVDTVTLKPKLIHSKTYSKTVSQKQYKMDRPHHKFKIAKRYNEALIQRMEWVPVSNKTRWKCIRCGWCCCHEWRVNMTWDEYDRLKGKLPIEEIIVDEKSGMSHPFFSIKNKCVQYDSQSHKCKIYKDRTYSCATFPFALTPKGKLVRSKFCKGFGSGEKVSKEKIRRNILKWRKRAGMMV